jgi:hypothetical protein
MILLILAMIASRQAVPADRPEPNAQLGCRNTHEWVNVGEATLLQVAGTVSVQYAAGDRAPLPQTTIIVARVEPFIQAFMTTTNQDGEFALPAVPEGRWKVNICQAGFKALEATVIISAKGAAKRRDFVTELDW